MDLSRWNEDGEIYRLCERNWKVEKKKAAIDVMLGRLVLFDSGEPKTGELVVTYTYGFSSEIGGGSYHRTIPVGDVDGTTWSVAVAKGTQVDTLHKALKQWDDHCKANPADPRGVIRILDNGAYDANEEIRLPAGASLTIVADNGTRPTLTTKGYMVVRRAGEASDATRSRQLCLNGLLVDGGLMLDRPAGAHRHMGRLDVTIEHCTLMPHGVHVALDADAARSVTLKISRSIVGPLYLPATTAGLSVSNTIVGNGTGYAVAAGDGINPPAGPAATFQRVTVFGQVRAADVTAWDTIFTGQLEITNKDSAQQLRFSYVRDDDAEIQSIFTSTCYGDPAYAQLGPRCPRQIRRGAADGSEMGAFHDLHQPQAEDNIQAVLDEYLPFGLQPGIFYVT